MEQFHKSIDWMMQHDDGCAFQKMGRTDDGRELYLVFGWSDAYERGEPFQQHKNDKCWTLVAKLAFNTDDLQCDYDFDWTMPWSDDGTVYDTDCAVAGDSDFGYYTKEAAKIIDMMNRGTLRIS